MFLLWIAAALAQEPETPVTLRGAHQGTVTLSSAPTPTTPAPPRVGGEAPCRAILEVRTDGGVSVTGDCPEPLREALEGWTFEQVSPTNGRPVVTLLLAVDVLEHEGVGRWSFTLPTVDALPQVHHAELKVKRRVNPTYPEGAKAVGVQGPCVARVRVDSKGTPTEVQAEDCPSVLHAATEEALMKWRFYPHKVDGVASACETRITVRYVLK